MSLPSCGLPSVVVLTWNDGPLLAAAVRSVPRDEAAEVVVIDNGSDPPADVPESARLIRLSENRGVAAGRNVGVAATTSDVVCFLDSDAEFRPGALRRLTEVLMSQPDIGMVAPVFEKQRPEQSGGTLPTALRKLARGLGLTTSYGSMRPSGADEWDVDFVIGACQVFRRTAFETVGGLDESIFYGPEDVDFCVRLRQRGYRILQVDRAPVWHPPRRRNRRLLSRGGIAHGLAVVRQLRRQRRPG